MEFIEYIKELLTMENLLEVLEEYQSFGPLPGFLLVVLEAFLPFLPLIVIVMANAAAFGLWLGFLISWSGAVVGAVIVYYFVHKLQRYPRIQALLRKEKIRKMMSWIERHGFGPIFFLLCFPFTPSFLINVVAGLSKIKFYQFFLALVAGKMVMIFTISYIGYDIISFIRAPIKTAIAITIMLVLWFIGKKVELRLQLSGEK
ncbi:TVP38/TMEM64 family protein [Sutcliffiella horikoshii]|uniref:TVP38/TMEM64 family membrane protein n=1 Tax=Sutcliffiella horikoshii TaxID=79883 RepID=A0A1Y0CKA0_9BACI|nr:MULTISPECIES: TVP38/TMEM64 family protein [Bacillaceae]ART75720.1 TVP38/TMEM64 family protein [Sutcliffiella horikoshii]TYS61000.1 TVP38/TMEM64 family protein [Sutcliffiella horikoshii]TYS73757.1 TVP38/TMEM64 family protein [Sutcliffiella horikoshii]UAL48563.1 TVP38/TMEM64 family protein [Sutcliffiella horikoshii]